MFNATALKFASLLLLTSATTLSACKNPLVPSAASPFSSPANSVGSASYRPMSLTKSSISGTGPVASDGVSTSVISIVLKDADDVGIEGVTPTFSATNTSMLNQYGVCTVTNSAGASSCTLKSGYAETKIITLRSPTVLAGNSVVFQDAASGIANSSITATSNISANNSSISAISLTLKDASNNPFSETPILSVSGTGNTLTCGTTNISTGVTTCSLKSTKAETKTITIVSPAGLGGLSTTSTFVVGVASTATSTLSTTTGVAADNSSTATVTLTVLDAYGNPISTTPTLSVTGTGNTTSCSATVAATGVSTCTIRTTKAETKTIAVTAPAEISGLASVTSTFVPGAASAATTTLVVTAGTPVADGVETATITTTLMDANSNPISGTTPTLSVTGSNNTKSCTASNASGVSTCTLSSITAQAKTITFATPTGLTAVTDSETFVADDATDNSSIAVSGTPTANGSDQATVTITLRDANNNLVSGITPTLAATGTGNTVSACSASSASGISTCTITSTIGEAKTLTLTAPASATATASATANFTPVVTSISPTADITAGGTTITVTGQGFKSGDTVKINSVACTTSTYVSATSMTCVVPAGSAIGTVNVTVVAPDNVTGTLSNGFSYVGSPRLWLRADAITGLASGDPISSWSDSSGNANHATQATATKQPYYKSSGTNSKPAVHFTGSNALQTGTGDALGDFTIFIIFKKLGSADIAFGRLLDKDFANGFWIGRNNTTANSFGGGVREGSDPYGIYGTFTDQAPHLLESIRTGTTHQLYRNGSLLTSNTVSSTATSTAAYGIGGDYANAGNYLYRGDISEIVVYNTALSTADRQAMESYLNVKYGQHLAVTTPQLPLMTNESQTFAGAGGTSPYTYSSTGVGSINSSTGVYSSAAAGSATVTVTDSNSNTASVTFSVTASITSPDQIPGLVLWLKGDAISGSDGDLVSTWTDSSVRGANATAAGAQRPTLKTAGNGINSRNVVRFDGTNHCLLTAKKDQLEDFSVFVVYRDNGAAGNYERLIDKDYANGFYLGRNTTTANTFGGSVREPNSPYGIFGSGFTDGTSYLIESMRTGSTHELYQNGSLVTSNAPSSAATSPTGYGLGCHFNDVNASQRLGGDLAEILVFDSYLTTLRRQQIETYLNSRYSLY